MRPYLYSIALHIFILQCYLLFINMKFMEPTKHVKIFLKMFFRNTFHIHTILSQ